MDFTVRNRSTRGPTKYPDAPSSGQHLKLLRMEAPGNPLPATWREIHSPARSPVPRRPCRPCGHRYVRK
jgi:hypothetical protein